MEKSKRLYANARNRFWSQTDLGGFGGSITNQIIRYEVSPEDAPITLLNFLQKKTKQLESNRFVKKAIENGFCRVNASYELFASKRLYAKDIVELFPDWVAWTKLPRQDPTILYEDEQILIIHKPVGLVCEEDSLQSCFHKKIFPVHRLDKKASGALLLAYNEKMALSLSELFARRDVKKNYVVLVDKPFHKSSGKVEAHLTVKKNLEGQKIYGFSNKGKYSLTYWEQIAKTKDVGCLYCTLITGRTHQLRVHFSTLGHPILGDFLYAKNFHYPHFMPRLFLHSYSLEFLHPLKRNKIAIKADLPEDFIKILPTLPQQLLTKDKE